MVASRDNSILRPASRSESGVLQVTFPLNLSVHESARLTELAFRVGAASGHQFLALDQLESDASFDFTLQLNSGANDRLPEGFCLDFVVADDWGRVSAPLRQCVEVQTQTVHVVAPSLASLAAAEAVTFSPIFLRQGLSAQWSLSVIDANGAAPSTRTEGDNFVVENLLPGDYVLTVEAGGFRDETRLLVTESPSGINTLVAGQSRVSAGESIRLFGDLAPLADGGGFSFRWMQDGQEIALTQDIAVATESADIGRQYQFQFEALRDSDAASASSLFQVTVRDPSNIPPVANAGLDQEVDEGSSVVLNGSRSSDVNDEPLSFSWAQIISPNSSAPRVALQNADQVRAEFVAPNVGSDQTLVFRLTVTDSQGNTDEDQVQVLIRNDLSGGN